MPEGPSILLVREALKPFIGKKVLTSEGNSKIDQSRLLNRTIRDVRSWGKHLLICFDDFTLRIHFLMFGTYLINERKPTPLRLSLRFKKAELNFYTCAIKLLEGSPIDHYDFSADVLSDEWNPRKAGLKLKKIPEKNVCDALLDQEIFSGVGEYHKE